MDFFFFLRLQLQETGDGLVQRRGVFYFSLLSVEDTYHFFFLYRKPSRQLSETWAQCRGEKQTHQPPSPQANKKRSKKQ